MWTRILGGATAAYSVAIMVRPEWLARPCDLVPAGGLEAAAQRLAEAVAANSPTAMAVSKRALWGALELGLTDACRAGARDLVSMWGHPDQAEGPAAFTERRPASWLPLSPEVRGPGPGATAPPAANPARPEEGTVNAVPKTAPPGSYSDYTTLVVDVTQGDATANALMARWGVVGVPTYILLGPDGRERRRFVGYVPAAEMVPAMAALLGPPRV